MKKIKIGVIKEGKVPPDKRVPLTPKQCHLVETIYPNVEVIVQPSHIRAYSDADYLAGNRTLYDKVNVISIPSRLYGNKIKT